MDHHPTLPRILVGALLPLLLLSTPAFAQDGGEPPSGFSLPKAEFPETEYQWDLATQGEVLTHTFPVRNTGTAPLKILRIQSNCGCTSSDYTKEIAPGEEGTITLLVDTAEISAGFLRKTGTVYTNDPANPEQILWMIGQVDPVLVSDEKVLKIKGLLDGKKQARFVLRPGTDRQTQILEAKFEEGHARIVAVEPQEDGSTVILASAGRSERPEILRDFLIVTVSLDGQAPIRPKFPVGIQHLDPIEVTPSGNLVFYRRQTAHLERDPDKEVSQEIQVRAREKGRTLKVLGARVEGAPDGLFSTEVRTVVPDEHYIVKVRVLKTVPESQVRALLVIDVDDPRQSNRTVQLFAQFRRPPPG